MFDKENIKAVLWDLDDTLYSRRDSARQVYRGMFKECLYPNADEKFIDEAIAYMMTKLMPNSMIHEKSFEALLEKYPSTIPYDHAKCAEYYFKHMPKFMTPFPEKVAVIEKLRALGIKTAIVTNTSASRVDSQKEKIKALGIAELFDEILISGEIGIHKPDRAIFDMAASRLGVKNEECLFVGDDPKSDVDGALGAEMKVLWFNSWNYDDLYRDDERVFTAKSVLEYFKF